MDDQRPWFSDNSQCYTLQTFTSVVQSYNIKHITSSPLYPQANGLAEKYLQIVKKLVLQSQWGRQRFLQVFHESTAKNRLTGIMKSPMQILQARQCRWHRWCQWLQQGDWYFQMLTEFLTHILTITRSDLPMSNDARKQLGIQPEVVRNNDKHAVLPMHDCHVGTRCHVSKFHKQALVPSCNSKFVF